MARSGRGRGRSALTFNIDALGLGKGEALPEAVFGPPPLYPKIDFKPTPLKTGEDEDYLLALKQELRNAMRSTPYFVTKRDDDQGSVPVERYSKKYLQMNEKALEWTPDWRRFPKELKPKAKTGKGGKLKITKTTAAPKAHVDVLKKIEELEEKGDGEKSDEEEKDKDKEEDGKEEESEEYDEEEHEEENDYIASYFEDGDDYGADSDDNTDEATY